MNCVSRICLLAVVISSVNLCLPAQERPRSVTRSATANPWSKIIPDPDKFDWNAKRGRRVGYYYRGILPEHQPFYDYIQDKRSNDLPLTWAEEALVRHLIIIRRWPDPPSPSPFWAACMRYLRAQSRARLSVAEMILLNELLARGLATDAPPAEPAFARVRNYLNSAPFEIRNWFERMSAQPESWMGSLNRGWGYDLPYDAPYDPSVNEVMKSELRETLNHLNDSATPLGREIEGMQKALSEGATAWDAFVEQRTKELREDSSPEASSYQQLENALAAGGENWRQYMQTYRATDTDETPAERATNVLEETPKDTRVTKAAELFHKAQAFAENNQYEQAVFAYTQAIDADPKSAEGYAGRALAKAALNDIEGAAADIGRALKLDPDCTAAFRARSIIKRALADPKGALADAARAVELAPANARMYLTRGLAYEALGDYRDAMSDYSTAIDLNPSYDQSYLYRGLVRLKLNQDQEAIDDFDKAISIGGKNSLVYANRGLAKESIGNLQGAFNDYQEALRLNPLDATARQGLDRLKSKRDNE